MSVIISVGSARQYQAGDTERRAIVREGVEAAETKIPQQESCADVCDDARDRGCSGRNQGGGPVGSELERLEHAGGKGDRRRQQKREPRRLLMAQTGNQPG